MIQMELQCMKILREAVLLFTTAVLLGGCALWRDGGCEMGEAAPFAPGEAISLEECLKYLRNEKRIAVFRKNYFALAEVQQQFEAAQEGFADVQKLKLPPGFIRHYDLRKRLIDLTARRQSLVLKLYCDMGFMPGEIFKAAFSLPETLPEAELPGLEEMEKMMALQLEKLDVAPSGLEMNAKLRGLYTRYLHHFELCRHYHLTVVEMLKKEHAANQNLLAEMIVRVTEARLEFIRSKYELFYICAQIRALTGIR